MTDILACLSDLYGPGASAIDQHLRSLLSRYALRLKERSKANSTDRQRPLDQTDAILITYGDQVRDPVESPLRALADFCRQHVSGVVNGVHLLPFYPYSSDDGFSVIDYWQVDPALGSWEDISRLGADFRLMFDLVINHVSAQSEWFQAFLRDEPAYRDYFICVEGDPDLSRVVRPRALPLLTRFNTPSGPKAVWTTFSDDQIDLNYANPDVLLRMIEVLLYYVAQGAEFIRLDAIAYLWKKPGTSCIHLPETHRVVQLVRLILDTVAPWVRLITETNVPHADNISYFGDGRNEAQLVYNFPLPPLVFHTLRTGDCQALTSWVNTLALPSDRTTFFNFLASHDGIGLNPARGILTETELQALVDTTLAHGGRVSYKANPDGTQSPYELNISYFDALSDPQSDEPLEMKVRRFVAAHAMMFSLVGVPGIYFHSLFGSSGWLEGVSQSGRNRTINREKLQRQALEADLANPESQRARVLRRLSNLLQVRATQPAFQPNGMQRAFWLDERVFVLERNTGDSRDLRLCLVNVTSQRVALRLDQPGLPIDFRQPVLDLVSGSGLSLRETLSIELLPYQVCWLAQV